MYLSAVSERTVAVKTPIDSAAVHKAAKSAHTVPTAQTYNHEDPFVETEAINIPSVARQMKT